MKWAAEGSEVVQERALKKRKMVLSGHAGWTAQKKWVNTALKPKCMEDIKHDPNGMWRWAARCHIFLQNMWLNTYTCCSWDLWVDIKSKPADVVLARRENSPVWEVSLWWNWETGFDKCSQCSQTQQSSTQDIQANGLIQQSCHLALTVFDWLSLQSATGGWDYIHVMSESLRVIYRQ